MLVILGRLGRVCYWIGCIGAGVFLIISDVSISRRGGDLSAALDTETVFLLLLALGSWITGWVVRFILSGGRVPTKLSRTDKEAGSGS